MLGRDIDRVIALDIDKNAAIPAENVLVVTKYDGAKLDKTLLDLLFFYRVMAASTGSKDVRMFIKAFEQNGPEFFKNKWHQAVKEQNRAVAGASAQQQLDYEDSYPSRRSQPQQQQQQQQQAPRGWGPRW
eukprot:TRINITY_DN1531_c0_g1_i3.p1 TRINITY_DN1531_c0_g1~~TRINITY_DN1531_c0_g1_i3.p1  ORF type:complete len:130 (-),score=36.45 TRINITY_DN1531_c0_g1_i3:102-491(-)